MPGQFQFLEPSWLRCLLALCSAVADGMALQADTQRDLASCIIPETDEADAGAADDVGDYDFNNFSCSFAKDTDADILCDVCSKEIQPGQCQICWVQKNAHGKLEFWVHSDCFPSLACQEGVEQKACLALCHHLERAPNGNLKQILEATLLILTDYLDEAAADEL
ncbi:unnamed protein product [Durusdinium trenchii]|uniref:Uncharacterized protein n=1 Tax=Durusdinium trenchii TaxID=1381693 RepID=A0ABP0RUI8_9DINO